jgi:hypothetical protein
MANTRLGSANVFSSLPFDQIDGVAGFFVHEDFEQAALLADVAAGTAYPAGNTDWLGAEIAGANTSNITVPVSVADHVGIIQIKTGTLTATDGDAMSLQFGLSTVAIQNMYLPDNNGLYIASVVRIPDVSDTIFEFGMGGQTPAVPNSSVADVVSFAFDPEDTTNVGDKWFFAQVSDGSTDSETILTNVNYTENDWVLLEIAVTDTSCHFRVTTEDATQTTVINDSPVVALRPFFTVENITTLETVVDIDLFHLRYLRRDSLVGTGSDWLGA